MKNKYVVECENNVGYIIETHHKTLLGARKKLKKEKSLDEDCETSFKYRIVKIIE
jgi:hypothetical protein